MHPYPVRVFVSYSHADEAYLEAGSLLGYLKGLEQDGVEFWTDRKLRAGELWDDLIKQQIAACDLALVLVSQGFLDSKYCTDIEIRGFLAGSKALIPVILSTCEWERHDWLKSRQFLPGGQKTVEEHYRDQGDRKRLFHEIRMHLRAQIERLRAARMAEPASPVARTAAAFVSDPAEPDGYRQGLDLPMGFADDTGLSAAFVRTYKQAFESLFSGWNLPVGTMPFGGDNRPIEAALDDMYQPLRLAEGFSIDETEHGTPVVEQALVGRGRSLVIRGPAGTGKTTWIRYTFRRLLRLETALPLILVVRDLARRWQEPDCKGAERALDAFLDTWVAEHLGGGWEGQLKLCLESENGARPVLLVDGWDEAGVLGEDLREKLLIFMKRYPRLLVVVTSRPYSGVRPSRSDGFEVLDTQPLSDPEIRQFARRFFLECHCEDKAIAIQESERFWAALERAPEPLGLARTALLLTMMLLISRFEPIPDKRHVLYEKCINNLLTALPDRKADQGALILYEQWRPDGSEERKRAVAALAFALQEQGYKEMSRSSVGGKWVELVRFLPADWPESKRSGFLAWLAGPAGLLTDCSAGAMAFAHLSFQEYLCAWYLHTAAEGEGRRSQEFNVRKQDYDWWETLRLWAALIEMQTPERLEPILDAIPEQGDGLAFVGVIFADGLGQEARFQSWCKALLDSLAAAWPLRLELCAPAWSASRQDERKSLLGKYLAGGAEKLGWADWIRRWEFMDLASFPREIPPPKRRLNKALVEVISGGRSGGKEGLATSRLLCGGPSIWPIEPFEAGFLQVWPGDRRLVGMRLQSAALAGGTLAELKGLMRSMPEPVAESDHIARELARYLARYLASDFPCDFARYLYRYFARYLDRHLDRFFARYFARYIERYFVRGHSRDLARDFARDLARDSPQDFVGDLARAQSLDPNLPWLLDFSRWEVSSVGRAGARFVLAKTEPSRGIPLLDLLSEACRLSLDPTLDRAAFNQLLSDLAPNLNPLWPALARHLVRCSTHEDRTLLSDLAQHPEKNREESLCWAFQFIVRGDVMLDDGSFITLDELTDQAGLPRLPYLEDLPDELEMDKGG